MSKAAMGLLYKETVNTSGLTNANFFAATQFAMPLFGSNCVAYWDQVGCHNGIDRDGAIWSGC